MELDPREADLILKIRDKYQFGEVLVECQNGLPWRIGRTITYEKLDSESK